MAQRIEGQIFNQEVDGSSPRRAYPTTLQVPLLCTVLVSKYAWSFMDNNVLYS